MNTGPIIENSNNETSMRQNKGNWPQLGALPYPEIQLKVIILQVALMKIRIYALNEPKDIIMILLLFSI